jgi:hypothetical protein
MVDVDDNDNDDEILRILSYLRTKPKLIKLYDISNKTGTKN